MCLCFVFFPIAQQESSKIFPTLEGKFTNDYIKKEIKFTSAAPWLCLCLLKLTSLNLKTKITRIPTEYQLFSWDIRKKLSLRANVYL